MLTKLQELLTFLPDAAVVPASYLMVVAGVALLMWIAFKIAMRILATMFSTVREVRKMALMMSGFTGTGAAIPLTMESLLAFLQSAI